MNDLINENFDLKEKDFDHQSTVNQYIISEVFGQLFFRSMYKQKNNRGTSIYCKLESPLPNIRYRNETADIFLFLMLSFNEKSIAGIINILREIADQLGLSDIIVKDKIILLKWDLMTVRNCRYAIYRRKISYYFPPGFTSLNP